MTPAELMNRIRKAADVLPQGAVVLVEKDDFMRMLDFAHSVSYRTTYEDFRTDEIVYLGIRIRSK